MNEYHREKERKRLSSSKLYPNFHPVRSAARQFCGLTRASNALQCRCVSWAFHSIFDCFINSKMRGEISIMKESIGFGNWDGKQGKWAIKKGWETENNSPMVIVRNYDNKIQCGSHSERWPCAIAKGENNTVRNSSRRKKSAPHSCYFSEIPRSFGTSIVAFMVGDCYPLCVTRTTQSRVTPMSNAIVITSSRVPVSVIKSIQTIPIVTRNNSGIQLI